MPVPRIGLPNGWGGGGWGGGGVGGSPGPQPGSYVEEGRVQLMLGGGGAGHDPAIFLKINVFSGIRYILSIEFIEIDFF